MNNAFLKMALAWVVLLPAFHAAFGQTDSSITFQKLYSTNAYDIGIDVLPVGSGYLVAGSVATINASNGDGLLMMVDSVGQVVWQKRYGGPRTDIFIDVIAAEGGGFIAAGATGGYAPQQVGPWVVRVDANGNPRWNRRWVTTPDGPHAHVLRTPLGYVVSGPRTAIGAGDNDGFATLLDDDGNAIWQTVYDADIQAQFVDGDTLFATGIADSNACLVKIDLTSGAVISALQFDGGGNRLELLHSLTVAPDGDFVLSEGILRPDPIDLTHSDAWVLKLARSGAVRWSKRYSSDEFSMHVETNPDNESGYWLTQSFFDGTVQRPGIAMRIDSLGNLRWARHYTDNGGDLLHAGRPAPSGGLIATGTSNQPFSINSPNIVLLKTDADGRIAGCCTRSIAINVEDYPVEILPLTVNALPAPAMDTIMIIQPIVSLNAFDYCLAGALPTRADTVLLQSGETIEIGGVSYSEPATVTLLEPAGLGCDTLVTYVIELTTGVTSAQQTEAFELWPNPTAGGISLSGKLKLPVQVRVLNAQGSLLAERVATALPYRLELPGGLAGGVYFLECQDATGARRARRFVIK